MNIFNCEYLRDKVEERLKKYIFDCKSRGVNAPKLTIVVVGNDGASKSYVKSKTVACERVGIECEVVKFKSNITEEGLIKKVKELSNNTDGIIVQLPIDSVDIINETKILEAIPPSKDVDGINPYNIGMLALNEVNHFIPCTSKGVLEILNHLNIKLEGTHIAVLGKGRTSGRPISLLLSNEGALVSNINSKTSKEDREKILKMSEIIISCTGIPNIINVNNIGDKTHTIINVGMTRNNDGKLVGDVDLNSFIEYEKVNNVDLKLNINTITKSTGLMTVSYLLENTCKAHYLKHFYK